MSKFVSNKRKAHLIQVCHLTVYGLIADFMSASFRGHNLKKVDDIVYMSFTGMIAHGFTGEEKIKLYDYSESPISTVEEFWNKEATFRAMNFLNRAGMYNASTDEIRWPIFVEKAEI